MLNDIKAFVGKNKKTLGIIALIIFAVGVYSKGQGIKIPFFTGSLTGTFASIGFNFGVIIAVIGLLLTQIKRAIPIGLALLVGGILLAGGGALTAVGMLFSLLANPIVAISLGTILAFFIFTKK